MSDKSQLMRALSSCYVLFFDQLKEGMNALGILKALKLYPEMMEPLFVAFQQQLTAGKKEQNITLLYPQAVPRPAGIVVRWFVCDSQETTPTKFLPFLLTRKTGIFVTCKSSRFGLIKRGET